MAMGACIVSCCLRSYKNRQQKRLEEAQHQNLRFVEANGAIGMPTEVDPKNTQVEELGAGAVVGDNEAQIAEKVEEINISINSEEAQIDDKTRKERVHQSMMVVETAR